MKPDFALEFTDKSVILLHRTARGWLNIGEAAIDAANLDEAVGYLRKTALELAPGGFTTKLVIPNAQILYAEIPVPAGTDAEIRTAISDALVARTPYSAEEIAFDWSGSGAVAKVAAVARQTLAEAEGFAGQHRLNPAGFVAIPPDASFEGEPWFGPAPSLRLPEGESLERDDSPITKVGEGPRSARARAPASERSERAPDGPKGAAVPRDVADTKGQRGADTQPRTGERNGARTGAADAGATPGAAASAKDASPAIPARQDTARPEGGGTPDATAPAASAVTAGRDDIPASRQAPAPPSPPPRGQPARQAALQPADHLATALAGADDGLPPAPAAAILAARAARHNPPAPEPATAGTVASVARTAPEGAPAAPPSPARPQPGVAVSPVPSPAATAAVTSPKQAQTSARSTPVTETARDAPASTATDTRAQLPSPAPSLNAPITAAGMAAGAALATPGPARDLPEGAPRTSGPVAAGTDPSGVRKPARQPPPRPRVEFAGKAERSSARQRGRDAARATPDEAARSLARGPIVTRQGQRGKPRYLGLILTAILLLCLALVAAWSSFYLASEAPPTSEPVAVAGAGDTTDTATSSPAASEADTADTTVASADTAPDADADAGADSAGADIQEEVATDAASAEADAPAPDVRGESPKTATRDTTADSMPDASTDETPESFALARLPEPHSAAEAAPAAPMPPPPEGLVYQFDADGLIVPVPEGIPSPDGYMIRAGRPPLLPPERSAEVARAARDAAMETGTGAAPDASAADEGSRESATASAEAPAATAGTGPDQPPVEAATEATEANAEPAAPAAGAAAGPGVDAAMPAGATGTDDATHAAIPAADAPVAVDPGLAEARPRPRPERIGPPTDSGPATADDDASLDSGAARDLALARAPARPETLVTPDSVAVAAGPPAGAREQTAAASLAAGTAEGAPPARAPDAAVSAAAGDDGQTDNPALVTVALRPAARPAGLSRAVEAAVNAALKTAQPAAGAGASGTAGLSAEESAEIDEPEIAVASAPSIPTRANVAKEATFTKAITLSKTSLIGVFGTPSNRHALIRSGNGKITRVKVGDRLEGGIVQAITQNEVRYQKGSKLYALTMPAG